MSHDDETTGRAPIGPAEMKILLTLLDELLELPDDASRERWLAERPAGQRPLLPALRRMMVARDASAVTLDRGPGLMTRMPSAAPGSNLQAGQLVGRYRLLSELGHGGMSEVWLARASDDVTADAVALKLPAVSLASTKFLERLTRERAILQRLTYNGKMYWVRPVSPYIAPYGPYGNYNHFAGMVELILPLPLAYLLFARINFEQRLLWLLSVILMAVALILSGSRGGILALGVELLVMMLIAVWAQRQGVAPELNLAGNKLIAGGALAAVLLLVLWSVSLWSHYYWKLKVSDRVCPSTCRKHSFRSKN